MIQQTFTLNLIPESAPVIVRVNQYDTGTGRLRFRLYRGSSEYTPGAGATAIIQGTKPDMHGFAYSASISGSIVTADLTQQMSAVYGDTRAQIVVTESTGKTGSFAFTLKVQQSALEDDTDISDTEIPALVDLAEANAERAEAAVEHYPYINPNNKHWMVWDVEQEQWEDTGVVAEGEDGTIVIANPLEEATGNLVKVRIGNSIYQVQQDLSGYQEQELSTPITVDGSEETTVEGTLDALNTLAAGNKTAIAGKQDTLTEGTGIDITSNTISVDADAAPTQGSIKPATSGGIYTAIQTVQTALNTYIESLGFYVENGYICQRIN